VRDGLIRLGIDLDGKYTSPLAVIHKALKRLDGKKEVRRGSVDGKTTYQWRTSTAEQVIKNITKPIEEITKGKK